MACNFNIDYVLIYRAWVTHPYPRHIELDGKDIKGQLVGADKVDPDMFPIIVRRFAQLDANMITGNTEPRWRHFLEPDFAVSALWFPRIFSFGSHAHDPADIIFHWCRHFRLQVMMLDTFCQCRTSS